MTSTTAPTETVPLGRRLLRQLPLIALILAIVAVLLLAAGPLGWRAGWWHFRFAFSYLMPWSVYCGLAAAAIAIIALAIGFRSNGARHIAIGVIAFVIGAAIAYLPLHYEQMRASDGLSLTIPMFTDANGAPIRITIIDKRNAAFPTIHDITTDWENPPQFHAILALREAEKANPATHEGAKVSDLQRKAYPDIAPVTLAQAPGEAFTRALKTAEELGWTIVATDPQAGRIEASQRSRWFGFTDDVVIRIAAAGSGSRVDVRSVSRVGRNDFGVNAARVRGYVAKLQHAATNR
jgi:uncharacterized protein (DUF1499 family)